MNAGALFFLVMGWGIILVTATITMLKIMKESK